MQENQVNHAIAKPSSNGSTQPHLDDSRNRNTIGRPGNDGRPPCAKLVVEEVKIIFRFAWPMVISCFLEHILLQLVASIFCGRRGVVDGVDVFAAFGVAIAFSNIFGASVIIGLSTAADTLFSQSFGGRRYSEVGLTLQRAILIYIPAIIIIASIFLNAEYLLVSVFNYETSLAESAGIFLKVYCFSLPAEFLALLLGKYIQCQGHVLPSLLATIFGHCVNASLLYIFLFVVDMGVEGAALSLDLSQLSFALTYLLIIVVMGYHSFTWPGWNVGAFYNWGPYVRLAMPGVLMTITEWLCYEIGSVLMGKIGTDSVDVQAVLYQIWVALSTIGAGFSFAGTIRIGHLLGAGDHQQASLSARVVLFFAVGVLSVFVGVLVLARRPIVGAFGQEKQQVVDECLRLVPYVVWVTINDCIASVCIGIMCGSGRQVICAVNNVIGYYIVGLPLSVALIFLGNMGVEGLWIGLAAGSSLQAVFLLVILIRTDWRKQALDANRRVGGGRDRPIIVGASRVGSAMALQRYSSVHQSLSTIHLPPPPDLPPDLAEGSSSELDLSPAQSLHLSSPDLAECEPQNGPSELPMSQLSLGAPAVGRTYRYQWCKVAYYFGALAVFFTSLYLAFVLPDLLRYSR